MGFYTWKIHLVLFELSSGIGTECCFHHYEYFFHQGIIAVVGFHCGLLIALIVLAVLVVSRVSLDLTKQHLYDVGFQAHLNGIDQWCADILNDLSC